MQELWLPANVRQVVFAKPLEESAIQLCRRLKYRAGNVTSSGTWQTANGIEHLASRTGELCPGEIDCLAVSEQGEVVVLECKVLNLPLTIVPYVMWFVSLVPKTQRVSTLSCGKKCNGFEQS